MKKTILILFAALSCGVLSAQITTNDFPIDKRNEIKLNLPTAAFAFFPEIGYDRVLSNDFTVGASLGVLLSNYSEYPVSCSFVPRARWFFQEVARSSKKYASGFFLEANGGIFSVTKEVYYDGMGNISIVSNQFDAGLGMGFGWKYLSHNNWVGELYYGAIRGFGHNSICPLWGVTIGKRF